MPLSTILRLGSFCGYLELSNSDKDDITEKIAAKEFSDYLDATRESFSEWASSTRLRDLEQVNPLVIKK